MAIFKRLNKATALLFAVTMFLGLIATGCSEGDNTIVYPTDKATLEVKVGLDESQTKGYDVPADVTKLALGIYDQNGERIDEEVYGDEGATGIQPWTKPATNERLLTMEIPEDNIDLVDRIAVVAFGANGEHLGVLSKGEVTCKKGYTTRVDFTGEKEPAFTSMEDVINNSELKLNTTPALDNDKVTIAVDETVTVNMDMIYTDANKVSFVAPMIPQDIVLSTEKETAAIDIEGNVITGKEATEGVEVKAGVQSGDAVYYADPFTVVVTGGPAPDFDKLYLCPDGYSVNEDGTEILDESGAAVADPGTIDASRDILINNSADFVVIAKDSDDVYQVVDSTSAVLLSSEDDDDDQVVEIKDRTVTGIAVGVTTLRAESLDGSIICDNKATITVMLPPATITDLYVCPDGYSVKADGTEILDEAGTAVADPSAIDASRDILKDNTADFVVIAKDSDDVYQVVNSAIAVLTSDKVDIVEIKDRTVAGINVGTTSLVARSEDGSIRSKNNATISVTLPPAKITDLYVCPDGYSVNDTCDGILDEYGAPVENPSTIDASITTTVNNPIMFVVIAKYSDNTYGMVSTAEAELMHDASPADVKINGREVTGMVACTVNLTAADLDTGMIVSNNPAKVEFHEA